MRFPSRELRVQVPLVALLGMQLGASLGCDRAPAPSAGPLAEKTEKAQPASVLPARQVFTHERSCLGTRCTFSVFHHDAALVERAVEEAMGEIRRLDALMSTWIESSDVSRINQAAGSSAWVPISEETFEVLEKSLWIAERSAGAFDITVGAFKGLWKFDEDNDGSLPAAAEVRKRLAYVDYRSLSLDARQRAARLARKGQRINLGGIAKGFIVDRAVLVLRRAGLAHFLVQAGGDLYAAGRRGDREWKVGIQDPRAPSGEEPPGEASFALLSLEDSAFNTSGDYERFIIKDGKRYHHILDPDTGQPVPHTRSVTVLAQTAFLADTLDTAVFVLGAERGLALIASQPGVEAVIVDADNRVHVSPGLRGRLHQLRPPTDRL